MTPSPSPQHDLAHLPLIPYRSEPASNRFSHSYRQSQPQPDTNPTVPMPPNSEGRYDTLPRRRAGRAMNPDFLMPPSVMTGRTEPDLYALGHRPNPTHYSHSSSAESQSQSKSKSKLKEEKSVTGKSSSSKKSSKKKTARHTTAATAKKHELRDLSYLYDWSNVPAGPPPPLYYDHANTPVERIPYRTEPVNARMSHSYRKERESVQILPKDPGVGAIIEKFGGTLNPLPLPFLSSSLPSSRTTIDDQSVLGHVEHHGQRVVRKSKGETLDSFKYPTISARARVDEDDSFRLGSPPKLRRQKALAIRNVHTPISGALQSRGSAKAGGTVAADAAAKVSASVRIDDSAAQVINLYSSSDSDSNDGSPDGVAILELPVRTQDGDTPHPARDKFEFSDKPNASLESAGGSPGRSQSPSLGENGFATSDKPRCGPYHGHGYAPSPSPWTVVSAREKEHDYIVVQSGPNGELPKEQEGLILVVRRWWGEDEKYSHFVYAKQCEMKHDVGLGMIYYEAISRKNRALRTK
ncbi:hypothetical protein CVT25_015093 [Psilocybe cyanescens]|uniref:Uncharacterized protein n=1 Tax=Psilocybe cyanescens TaxID=93625 RepID=A0A409WS69_PSICY|nr:hypothetical protein CVT25_015093 [Psilocybe cyanescens]